MDIIENDILQYAVYEQALALYEAGSYSEVLSGMKAIIPDALSALSLDIAAACACALERYDEAEKYWCSAIAMKRDYVDAYNELGILFRKLKRFEESEAMYNRAIELAPEDAKLYNNIANLFRETGDFEKAQEGYKKALQLDPQYAEAYRNLGMMYKEAHCYEEAEASYKEALKIIPDCAQTQANLGYLLLELGRYREGWPLYETRYDPRVNPTFARYEFSFPRWRGESLEGKTILIVPEQGFGDEIQFVRFVTLLKERGARVTLMCKQPLQRLFSTLQDVESVIPETETPQKHDFWSFLLTVPLYFGTILETIPGRLPYLNTRHEWITEKLLLPKGSFIVGLVWKGSSEHGNDIHRSLREFSVLEPLWSVPEVTFVSLQKGPPITNQTKQPIIEREIDDFADTAVLISQLDLVICVDTSVAHLCGALGKKCWVLLPFIGCDWRWMRERDDSPWYPNVMHLVRQNTANGWDETIAKIVTALSDEVEKRRAEN